MSYHLDYPLSCGDYHHEGYGAFAGRSIVIAEAPFAAQSQVEEAMCELGELGSKGEEYSVRAR